MVLIGAILFIGACTFALAVFVFAFKYGFFAPREDEIFKDRR